ncbi:MAG: HAD family hydrolase [Candidatus Omnitrophica bacterium]|nr:HAD family hydrolase [Candidatus Omnitrophota bacterium]
MSKTVFLDRDGVVNHLIYVPEHGRVETPLRPQQFRLMAGVAKGIKTLQAAGFQVVLVSNQPGIAKGQLTLRMFARIRAKAQRLLAREGVRLDGEYYCLHHPQAARKPYRKRCACRKPQPGLILQAARERASEVRSSFMVGDGLVDVEAGQRAGCHTILVGHTSSLLTRVMKRKQLFPTYLAENFDEAVDYILDPTRPSS